jgi:hypothetical protein
MGSSSYFSRQRIWVTLLKQTKKRCAEFAKSSRNLNLRLKQYLGLRESDTKGYFYELIVKRDALERPCEKTDVNIDKCKKVDCYSGSEIEDVTSYNDWFKRQSACKNYNHKDAIDKYDYPFTRLGYTYDWGGQNHVGGTEFIIRKQTKENLFQTGKKSSKKFCKE